MIEMTCPGCGRQLHIEEMFAGLKGKCSFCQGAIRVPAVLHSDIPAGRSPKPKDSAPSQINLTTPSPPKEVSPTMVICFWTCVACSVVWIVFAVGMCLADGPPFSVAVIWAVAISSVGVAIGSFALSYLGSHIIKRNKGAIRLGVLISFLWAAGSFVAVDNWTEFLVFGIIPVVTYWGILWAIFGFISSKNEKEHSRTSG